MGTDLPAPFAAPDPDTAWLFGLNRMGIRPGLVRIRGLLRELGDPHRGLPALVVAGTNGKGSTTRILARLLQAAGLKTATYTSPHLLQVTERLQIAERSMDTGEFSARVRAIRPLAEKHQTSWFETLTALAIQHARDEGVDILCCETGLGGRLDASNILEAEAVLLTTVGLDHQRILGETLTEIAAEKLGLLKRGVPLFCGLQESLRAQAFAAAVNAGSPCHFLDEVARWQDEPAGSGGDRRWRLTLRDRVLTGLPDPGTLRMRRNVALALLALAELEKSRGRPLLPEDPPAALATVFLPGRYQTVLRAPDWIFDTAHNPQALDGTLGAFLEPAGPGRQVVLLGSMHDKEWPRDLGRRLEVADAVLAAPVSLPRSRAAGELAELCARWGRRPEPWVQAADPLAAWRVAPDLGSAVAHLALNLKPEDRVLVTGSCFLVAEVLHLLGFRDLEETRRARPAAEVLGPLAANRRNGS